MYLLVKYVHILVAILALGGSAGLGILLEFYGDDPRHGAFVLRAIHRIETFFVLPGYAAMLATGLWLTEQSWNLTLPWIQGALMLWALGAVFLGVYPFLLRHQIALFEALGPASVRYRRVSLLGRALGAAGGILIPVILYLMVAKPELPFWPR